MPAGRHRAPATGQPVPGHRIDRELLHRDRYSTRSHPSIKPRTHRCVEIETRAQRGATRRSEIFSGYTVGFSSSTHRSHQKPLHVLIGSPLTIYRRRTQTTKWHHQKSAAVGFKYIGTSRAHSFKAHLKSAGLGGLSPAGGKESRSACPIHPLGQFTRAARLPLLVSLCPSI